MVHWRRNAGFGGRCRECAFLPGAGGDPFPPKLTMTTNASGNVTDRRGFCRDALRQAAVVTLVGGTVLALRQSDVALCQRTSGCGVCPELGGCRQPAATEWRQRGERKPT